LSFYQLLVVAEVVQILVAVAVLAVCLLALQLQLQVLHIRLLSEQEAEAVVLVLQHQLLELEYLHHLLAVALELGQVVVVLVAQEAVIEEMLVAQVAQAQQGKETLEEIQVVHQDLAVAVRVEEVRVLEAEMLMAELVEQG
jgi:hypothetical protein